MLGENLPRRLEAAGARHRRVHDDHLRLQLRHQADRLVAVAAFADDRDAGSSSSRRRKPRRTSAWSSTRSTVIRSVMPACPRRLKPALYDGVARRLQPPRTMVPSIAPASRRRAASRNSIDPCTSSARSRMAPGPGRLADASRGGVRRRGRRARDPRLRAPARRARRAAGRSRGPRRNAWPRCSAPPAARGTRGCRSSRRPAPRCPARSYVTSMPSCFSTVERYQSTVLSSPSSSRIDGCSVCDRPRTLSSAVCATSRISRRSARSSEPSGACLPARPSIEPIAVRIWPNSSCSSREISRSVDSRVAMSRLRQLAPLVGQRRELREQPAVRVNQIQAGRDDRGQRRGQEPVDLTLHAAVDVLHLLRGLLLARVVLHEQPRDRRAQRGLPLLQRQPDLRARLVLAARFSRARRCDRRRPRTARAGWRDTAAAPASAARAPPRPAASAPRRDRCGCDRTATTTP